MADYDRTKRVANYFEPSDHNSQRSENRTYTFCKFDTPPVGVQNDGTAVSGVDTEVNNLIVDDTGFEYINIGTQTTLLPVLTATGLDVGRTQTNDIGTEITQGILSRCRRAFTIGTDAAFFLRVKFKIADVSGTDDCAIGFRKSAAYAAAIDDYTDFAVLNVISGDIKIETALNNAATTTTDTTSNWADGETHTLAVYVSAAGVVTYKIDEATPSTVAAFTFDSTDTVIPFFYFLHASDVAGAVELIEWECGYDGDQN